MPKFALSQLMLLPFDFKAEVTKLVQAKKDHLTTEGVPAPSAIHPYVEMAVRRVPASVELLHDGKPSPHTTPDDFVADYEIEDDSPLPPTVAQKKDALAAKVNAEANALSEQIAPRLKQKLFNLQFGEAFAVPEDKRTPEQQATIAEQMDRLQKSQAIFRHVAEVESQIHDLPDDMVDVWKAPPFPGS